MARATKLSITETEILDVCCKIEETCSSLYQYFSKLYEDNPQACELWEKTSKEEDNHAEQFRLACRIQGCGVRSLKTEMKRATSILGKIQTVYENVQKSPPPLMDALKFAVRLERSLAEYHMNTIAVYDDENLERLFTAMMKNDREHIQRLEKASEAWLTAARDAANC